VRPNLKVQISWASWSRVYATDNQLITNNDYEFASVTCHPFVYQLCYTPLLSSHAIHVRVQSLDRAMPIVVGLLCCVTISGYSVFVKVVWY